MADFVLLIDDQLHSIVAVEEAVQDTGMTVLRVEDLPGAKRKLITFPPKLILLSLSGAVSSDAAFKFCEELRAHAQFSSIPILLFVEKVTDDSVRRATETGTNGLMPMPIRAEMLQRRIQSIFPELVSSISEDSAPDDEEEETEEFEPTPARTAPSDSSGEEKLKAAQQLLAKVLHNLKTSALLDVTELEDIPQIVLEMTRSVCDAGGKSRAARPPDASKEEAAGVDLAKVFGPFRAK